ncbi:MAG: Ku protein [Gemmatimonadaceae bacterium]
MATRSARARKWRSPKKRTAKKTARRGKGATSGARAIWKGVITFGSIEVPVKLYSAVQDKSIHFRLLDPKRKEPVKQQMIDPSTGDVVPHEEIHKAYQSKAGVLVMLDAQELEAAEPEDSRDIEMVRFVDAQQIAPAWYDRPYYLGPDGESKAYFALARALANQKKEGIARWVMRKKDYVGALKAEGDYLALITLRHTGEVVPADALPSPGGRDLDKREVDMARQLVESMVDDFDIKSFKDEYRNRVLELVEAKAAGKVLKFPKTAVRKEPTSLASVLEKSLVAAKKRRKSA